MAKITNCNKFQNKKKNNTKINACDTQTTGANSLNRIINQCIKRLNTTGKLNRTVC